MQDLLKEDDFIRKLPKHDPWRVFIIFYLIAFTFLVLICVALYSFSENYPLWIAISTLIIPTLLVFLMAFIKKQHAYIPLKTMALGMSILLSIFYLPILSLGLLASSDFKTFLLLAGLYAGNFILCCAIVLPIFYRKQKKFLARF